MDVKTWICKPEETLKNPAPGGNGFKNISMFIDTLFLILYTVMVTDSVTVWTDLSRQTVII